MQLFNQWRHEVVKAKKRVAETCKLVSAAARRSFTGSRC